MTSQLDYVGFEKQLREIRADQGAQATVLADHSIALGEIRDGIDALVVALGSRSDISAHALAVVKKTISAMTIRPMLILIVEDDPDVVAQYRKVFRGAQVFDVGTCAGAQPFLQAYGGGLDLVILDYGLPDGNGLDGVLRPLRALPGGTLVPVVVVTGYGTTVKDAALAASGPNSVCHVIDKEDARDFLRERVRNGGFSHEAEVDG